jgi:hypothetical protein
LEAVPVSLSTTIAAGTLLGGLLAGGVYAATAPSDQVPATSRVAPTYGPVPTPVLTELADCEEPATLEDGVCVTNVPGPTVTLPATTRPAPAGTAEHSGPAKAPSTSGSRDTRGGDDATEDDHATDDDHADEDDHSGEDDHADEPEHDDDEHEDDGAGH